MIDVVLSGTPHLQHDLTQYYNAFGVAERTLEIMNYYERMFGVLRAKAGHPKVNYRYIIGPNREMPTKIVPMSYTKHEVEIQMKLGRKDVKEMLTAIKEINKEKSKEERESKDANHHKIVMSTRNNIPTKTICDRNKMYYNKEK